jgi:hypothetical protein
VNEGFKESYGRMTLKNPIQNSKCLEVDASGNRVVMAKCENNGRQTWTMSPINNTDYSRVQNNFAGNNMCLELINDGSNNRFMMNPCNNSSGQQWVGPPNSKMQNNLSGPDMCLDLIYSGPSYAQSTGELTMNPCATYIGQKWVYNT